jgi:hypothetical protein
MPGEDLPYTSRGAPLGCFAPGRGTTIIGE